METNDIISIILLLLGVGFAGVMTFVIYKNVVTMRYHSVNEGVAEENIMDFGVPVKSLYSSCRLLTLHRLCDIVDESGQVVYTSRTNFLSILDKTYVSKADGSQIAYIIRKFFSLHARHFIQMENGQQLDVSREILHVVKTVINVEDLGWTINGHFLHMNYYITDKEGAIVASVGQKILSLHDMFSIDIYQSEYEEEIVAVFITLLHIVQDSRNTSSASASASSN